MTASRQPFRHAYTMIEILIAVTLSMILMLAVTNLFSRVGGMMSDTQATLIMAQNLSAVRNRLDSDLCNRTVETVKPFPPSHTPASTGFFSYVEGPMWQPTEGDSRNGAWGADPWCSWNIAYNPDDGGSDQTVGDLDDVLSFTVEYKNIAGGSTGKTFRARAIAPSGHLAVVESNAAEVHWFVRGNTLYRRTLLIEDFSEPGWPTCSLSAWKDDLPTTANCRIDNQLVPFARADYWPAAGVHANSLGYYTFFDVSTRLELNGSGFLEFHANMLSNLELRENRFGIYHNPNPVNSPPSVTDYWEFYDQAYPVIRFPFNPYDPNPGTSTAQAIATNSGKAWYFLRMPTQKETSHEDWAAGVTQQTNPAGMTYNGTVHNNDSAQTIYGRTVTTPYMDFWAAPDRALGGSNSWSALDAESNTLSAFDGPRYTDDVVLTNVIAFDVKAWDDLEQRYLDLGERGSVNQNFVVGDTGFDNYAVSAVKVHQNDLISHGTSLTGSSNPNTWLAFQGLYSDGAVWGRYDLTDNAYVHANLVDSNLNTLAGAPVDTATIRWNFNLPTSNVNPQLACVYDTFTNVYETAAVPTAAIPPYNLNGTTTYTAPGAIAPDTLDWACPPPYGDTPLKGVQVTVRTFDPRSGHIREAKVIRNLQTYD